MQVQSQLKKRGDVSRIGAGRADGVGAASVRALQQECFRLWIFVDAVYEDASVANLRALDELRKEFGSYLVVDGSLALFGGRNLKLSLNWSNAYLKPVKPDVLLGSLERHSGFSSVGGFCCGPAHLVGEAMRLAATGYCFSASGPAY